MTEEEAPPDVKRRRLLAADGPHQGIRCLTDLPSGILAHTASFLAAPSRALFAVALDEDSAVTPNERSSIVGSQWDVLDFGQIERELAKKLTDAHIKRVLLCTDAVNNVKRLKLTNCTKIFGTCLEPLRDSSIIEQIDLSLVGNEKNPDLEPAIPCDNVLPILDSIIEREGCALQHLQFPSVWRKEPSDDSDFHAFLERYNEMRRNRGTVRCLECSTLLPVDGDEWIEIDTDGDNYYGTHFYTCYGCFKHYCYGCHDEEGKTMLHYCNICNRDYCKGCSEMTECSGCTKKICHDCYKYECVECIDQFCLHCAEKGIRIDECDYCDKCYCRDCYDEEVDIIYTCSRCDVKCCKDCRLQRYQQEQLNCTQCIKESEAMDESLARNQLQKENGQLKVEVEELKRENRELKLENKQLRSKLN